MKKIYKIITFLLLITSFTLVSANHVDFYGEKSNSWDISYSQNIFKLDSALEDFYKSTGLNTDIIILGKGDSCYLKSNFDSCIQKRENYSSDLLIILSMKSNIKSRGDIRSLIKDEFKESITPRELKNLQDRVVIPYFKNQDFVGGLNNYLLALKSLVNKKCKQVGLKKCDAIKLAKEYHNYVAKKELEKSQSAKRKIYYYILFIVLVIISYISLRKIYIFKLNNLYKDIKFKILTIGDYKIFKKDKEKILNMYSLLEKPLSQKLGDLDKNIFTLIKYYNKYKNIFEQNNKELEVMQKAFLEKEEVKQKVEKFKNIDL